MKFFRDIKAVGTNGFYLRYRLKYFSTVTASISFPFGNDLGTQENIHFMWWSSNSASGFRTINDFEINAKDCYLSSFCRTSLFDGRLGYVSLISRMRTVQDRINLKPSYLYGKGPTKKNIAKLEEKIGRCPTKSISTGQLKSIIH
ncbi:hypothetical protein DDR33_02080 [Pararcticibacter amylolyticus]|uniref:Uncharacterized protein n=1 Tax=Pararcticibacter amylolyticus TaxID=2173175 RepID=A0A2U2PMQ6_9SPHI|nr:hypothetical protein DDR33_02080 [Pararcticibacter amylolyticus]